MDTMYLICAIIGGTLIVCQFLMTVLGLSGDHDVGGHDFAGHEAPAGGHDIGQHEVGHGSEPTWFFSLLTFRTLSAAMGFFGLAGLAASKAFTESPWPSLIIALLAGGAALFGVAKLMAFLTQLNVDGTVRIDRAIGARGTVYLTIPGNRAGPGKVHVDLLGRSLEYNAITPQGALPTGAPIVVVGVVNADTVLVTSSTPIGSNPDTARLETASTEKRDHHA